MAKTTEGNGKEKKQEPYVLPANSRVFFESVCNCHRVLVRDKTSKDTLESKSFLSACRDRMRAGDIAHVFDESFRTYFQAVIVGIPDASFVGGDIRLVVLLGPITLPEIDAAARDLPEGYDIKWNPATRQYVPYFGEIRMDSSGFPNREDARRIVIQHARTVSVVPR